MIECAVDEEERKRMRTEEGSVNNLRLSASGSN